MLAVCTAFPAGAQDTAAANTQIALHRGISVYAIQDMDFGQIVTRGPAGTVTVASTAAQTCTVTGLLVRSGPCRAAMFSGYGGLLSTIRVQRMPGNMLMLTGPGGATMTVTNLTYASDATMIQQTSAPTYIQYLIIDLDGLYLLRVGGRLNVGAFQAPGVYHGSITVQLNYN